MAEIFMKGIPFSLGHINVVRHHADILHGPEFALFSSGHKLNFQIHLFPNKSGGSGHVGQGVMTLPSLDIAHHFLQTRGTIRPHGISYEFSKKEARKDIVEEINNTPYQDPQHLEDREKLLKKLSHPVRLTCFQFGWRCRDDRFSIEWESFKDEQFIMGAHYTLYFEDDNKELHLSVLPRQFSKLPIGDSACLADQVWRPSQFLIVIKYSQIESIEGECAAGQSPAVILTLRSHPSLEHEPSSMLWEGQIAKRFRLTQFSEPHGRVCPFVSQAMRLQCSSPSELYTFLSMAREVHFQPSVTTRSLSCRRELFHPKLLLEVGKWINSLDWPVAFQCMVLLSNLLLDAKEVMSLRERIEVIVASSGERMASEVLRLFVARLKVPKSEGGNESGAMTIEGILQKAVEDVTPVHMAVRDHSRDDSVFDCFHASITPTRVILDGPHPDQSNRVIRRYKGHHHCFLRVNFTDEEQLGYRWDRGVDGSSFVRQHVGGLLRKGLTIAGRRFEFLAYSSSALRDHAVWFCTPFRDSSGNLVNAEAIRESLGKFTKVIKCPARYGARLSQAFTSTEASISLDAEEIRIIDDVVSPTTQSMFTDGIGSISRELADRILNCIESRPGNKKKFWVRPSAYQIRIGGCKGVLCVDYKLTGSAICVRPSMVKFDAPNSHIEVASTFHCPGAMYLNRPLIMILETLGVPKSKFVVLQNEAVADIHNAAGALDTCAKLIDAYGNGSAYHLPSIFFGLHKLYLGLEHENVPRTISDPFLSRAIEFAANHALRDLKHYARIPLKDSYTLVGVVDEHGWLEPSEIFACIRYRDSPPFYLKGKVLITRAPQVHPGDVQFVHAIGEPPEGSPFQHEEFPNCVVFSRKGERSVPSMLAGGDLDGDLYNIITDEELFPKQTVPPGSYDPAKLTTVDHDCTVEDLANWVTDFITADILGQVSKQFLILADQSKLMALDPDCIKLAELASAAVDFMKSGTPVKWEEMPKLKYIARPDWSAGEMGKVASARFYESQRAIGALFRSIDLSDINQKAAQAAQRARITHGGRSGNVPRRPGQDQLLSAMEKLSESRPSQSRNPITLALMAYLRPYIDVQSTIPWKLTKAAVYQFEAYAPELRLICATCSITKHPLSEEEVFMGTIAANTSQVRKREKMMGHLRTRSEELVKKALLGLAGDVETSSLPLTELPLDDLVAWLLRGWVAWNVSLSQEMQDGQPKFGAKSFGWIALGSIFEAVKVIEERNRTLELSAV